MAAGIYQVCEYGEVIDEKLGFMGLSEISESPFLDRELMNI